ncbi:hypothetical protein BC936DRAFT_139813 [Jimgerdemannia flammicorona]|uniref:F-box domain-containing protein n=1 Tax=Jimgerdemannia flammicorona TaxID=994334 RepID=A0A433DHK5_9FUNG|nr:hypothetical protein BC936DRAFT_139813 [Jimgerdemannia flammicorona]
MGSRLSSTKDYIANIYHFLRRRTAKLKATSTIEVLPIELKMEIANYLDFPNLYRLRAVSKSWKYAVGNSSHVLDFYHDAIKYNIDQPLVPPDDFVAYLICHARRERNWKRSVAHSITLLPCKADSHAVLDLVLHSDMVLANYGRQMALWDLASESSVATYRTPSNQCLRCCGFDWRRNIVVAGTISGAIEFWEARTGVHLETCQDEPGGREGIVSIHIAGDNIVTMSDKGHILITSIDRQSRHCLRLVEHNHHNKSQSELFLALSSAFPFKPNQVFRTFHLFNNHVVSVADNITIVPLNTSSQQPPKKIPLLPGIHKVVGRETAVLLVRTVGLDQFVIVHLPDPSSPNPTPICFEHTSSPLTDPVVAIHPRRRRVVAAFRQRSDLASALAIWDYNRVGGSSSNDLRVGIRGLDHETTRRLSFPMQGRIVWSLAVNDERIVAGMSDGSLAVVEF